MLADKMYKWSNRLLLYGLFNFCAGLFVLLYVGDNSYGVALPIALGMGSCGIGIIASVLATFLETVNGGSE